MSHRKSHHARLISANPCTNPTSKEEQIIQDCRNATKYKKGFCNVMRPVKDKFPTENERAWNAYYTGPGSIIMIKVIYSNFKNKRNNLNGRNEFVTHEQVKRKDSRSFDFFPKRSNKGF